MSEPAMPHRTSPQLARIARLMSADVAALAGLVDVPDDDLRTLHDQIAELYFAAGRESFARVAGLSKALPAPIAGRLAERFLPPPLAAQVAVLLEPARARDLVNRVSLPYLAQLSLSLDPTRAAPVVRAIPAARIGEITAQLFADREYAAVAEFAATVTRDALRAAVAVADGHDLLEIAPLLARSNDLDAVLAQLPPRQLDQVLAAIAEEQRWRDGDYLLARLPEPARRTAINCAGAAPDEVWDALGDAARRGRLGSATTELIAAARAARHART